MPTITVVTVLLVWRTQEEGGGTYYVILNNYRLSCEKRTVWQGRKRPEEKKDKRIKRLIPCDQR